MEASELRQWLLSALSLLDEAQRSVPDQLATRIGGFRGIVERELHLPRQPAEFHWVEFIATKQPRA